MPIKENPKNTDSTRKYYVPAPVELSGDPNQHIQFTRIEVTEEVYKAFYQPIWRARDHAKRHGGCSCADWKKCDGDCGTCRFRTGSDTWSLDKMLEDIGDAAYADNLTVSETPLPRGHHNPYTHTEETEVAADDYSRLLDEIAKGSIADRIKALPEPDRQICECVLMGLTERESSARLGIGKSTYGDRKLALFARLRKEWADLL